MNYSKMKYIFVTLVHCIRLCLKNPETSYIYISASYSFSKTSNLKLYKNINNPHYVQQSTN